MPQESQLAHRVLTNLALPYQTNTSPTVTDPHYIAGSFDILTSINGYAERRPGFSLNVEPTPTTFNNLQRLFPWDRFDGSFFIMACDIDASGFAHVYKFAVGVDASFVSIFTEPSATGSAYDFVTSNNTVYFSNGTYVRKWDPINGLSNWGIAPYSAAASNSEYCGTGADGGANGPHGTNAWTNPTNIQGAPDAAYATAVSSKISGSATVVSSHLLNCTNYNFGGIPIPAGNTIQGVEVIVTGHLTINSGGPSSPGVVAQLLVSGAPTGAAKSLGLTSTTDVTLTFGSASDLWNAGVLSPGTINPATFGVQLTVTGNINNFTILNASWNVTFSLDSAQIFVFSSGGPNVTFTGTGLTATTGYQYVLCWGNSNTGHVGSPSPPSNLVKPVNQSMSIPVVASTDPQVNQIRIFRTTDSATGLGGQSYFEIPNSPVPNANASITDGAADINLNALSLAPTPTFNDPPSTTPNGGLRGLVYFAGRIWGFSNSAVKGNQVWFTGLEEITIGVPEETMPSGIAGNFWNFDEPVQALGVGGIGTNQGLAILSGGRLYGIQGNSLDTFVRFNISNRRGARNRTCTSSLGGMLAWLDSANQVWATDGTNLNELSTIIRNDLSGINQQTCSLTFHTAGRFHWLVLSTGTRLYVYDVDQDQWMPPWTFASPYITSGEISPGNYMLLASTGTQAVMLNTSGLAGSFNDINVPYTPVMKFGLLSVVPDYGTRFSYIGVGSYNEPTRTGYPSIFQVTNSGHPVADFLICQDDDPTHANYTTIASNVQDTAVTFNRVNGAFMKQYVFPTIQPAARWIGMQIKLATADQVDNTYEVFMGYKSLGGR